MALAWGAPDRRGGIAPRWHLQQLTPLLVAGNDHSSRPPIEEGVATAYSCTCAAVALCRRSPRPGSGHRAAHSARYTDHSDVPRAPWRNGLPFFSHSSSTSQCCSWMGMNFWHVNPGVPVGGVIDLQAPEEVPEQRLSCACPQATAAISVGWRPTAHKSKIGRASRAPYRARRNAARIWACSSSGISTKVLVGMARVPRYSGVWQRPMYHRGTSLCQCPVD